MDPVSHFKNEQELLDHFKGDAAKIHAHIDHLYKTESSFKAAPLKEALAYVSAKVSHLFVRSDLSPSPRLSQQATFSSHPGEKVETAKVISTAEEILNKQNKSLLDEIIKNKDSTKLDYLLKNGFDLNRLNVKGETYLTAAIRIGDSAAVEFLMRNGADINKPNANGELPLKLALIVMPDQVIPLIQKGADVLKEVGERACPLSLIFYSQHMAALNELSEHDFDFNVTDSSGNNIALNTCASDEVASFLLQNGIGSKFSKMERTKLFFNFIDKGFQQAPLLLIKQGIDFDTVKNWDGNSKGQTPFMYAVHRDVFEVARLIIQQDPVQLAKTDGNGRSILLQVVSECFNREQIDFLLDLGCDPAQKDPCGWSAMEYCFSRVFNENVWSKQTILEKMLSKHQNPMEFIESIPLNPADREHLLRQLAENPQKIAEPGNQEIIADAVERKMALQVTRLCTTPIDPGTFEACRQLRQKAPPIKDVSQFAQKEPLGFQRLQQKRMGLSTTIGWNQNQEAMKRWSEGDDRIRELAIQKKPVTKAILCQLNAMINDNEGGMIRKRGIEVGTTLVGYVRGHTVEEQLNELLAWMDNALVECEQGRMDPIVVAAHVYQRMVSIHPFNDGNGRTTRYLMDYVLQRNGLPPASLEEPSVAVFALIIRNVSSTEAVEKVRAGVEKSYQLLNVTEVRT